MLSSVICCNTDVNRVACMFYGHCNPCCWNYHKQFISTPPNRFSTCGGTMMVGHNYADGYSHMGSPVMNMDAAVHGMTRSPTRGSRPAGCWAGTKTCECYEWTGCAPFWPATIPSPSTFACSSVRTHGFTPGHGVIRIKYLSSIGV